jgi:Glycyl-tRNA synthetase, beta subunit
VLQSFLKARGLASLDACEQRESGRGAFWFYVERVAGRPTGRGAGGDPARGHPGLPWPKSMRWAYDRQSWVRPLRNIAAVLDGALVPFEVELGSPLIPHRIASRNETFGHRFLGPQSFVVADFKSYKARLLARQVMLDPRSGAIRSASRRESLACAHPRPPPRRGAARRGGRAGGMAGGPAGTHRRAYMDLPPEVLTTVMRAHQKYFALEDSHGRLAPRFIIVSNMETRDHGTTVVAGNERVLRARLADASSSGTRIARPRWNPACRR